MTTPAPELEQQIRTLFNDWLYSSSPTRDEDTITAILAALTTAVEGERARISNDVEKGDPQIDTSYTGQIATLRATVERLTKALTYVRAFISDHANGWAPLDATDLISRIDAALHPVEVKPEPCIYCGSTEPNHLLPGDFCPLECTPVEDDDAAEAKETT